MAYTYDPIFAQDPNNPNVVASNATITIYNPADSTQAPIAITDASGSPLPNPIKVDGRGMGPAFQHPTLDRVAWTGGGFQNFFTSYEGMRNEASAAREAAQSAADTATAAAAEVVTAAAVNGSGKLILTKANGATQDAGSVVGPAGPKGDKGADGSNVLPTDDAIEQAVKTPGSKTAVALSATIAEATAGKADVTALAAKRTVWRPNTAYAAGEEVVNPSGDVVSCKSNFTSGATYDPTKWSVTLPAVATGNYINFKPENFRKFRAAIARQRAGGSVARVSFIGDSNTNGYQVGQNPVAQYSRSYGYRAMQILDGVFGPTQRGIVYPIIPGASFRWDDGVVTGSGWTHLNTTALGAGASGVPQAVGASAGYLDYTPPAAVNSFSFWARKYPTAGTLTYQIDAEAAVTVDLNSATEGIAKYTVTTATVGTHKIRIQNLTGTNHVLAFEGWDSTKVGPRFTFVGVAGGDMVNRIGTIQGGIPASNRELMLAAEPANPDLVILNAYINDHAANATTTAYKSALGTFIDAAQVRADVILMGSAYSGSGTLATWPDYRNAMLEVAIQKGCGFIDMPARWGAYATASAAPYNLWNDTDHPTSAGYWDMGEAAAGAIKLAAGRSA